MCLLSNLLEPFDILAANSSKLYNLMITLSFYKSFARQVLSLCRNDNVFTCHFVRDMSF